jgi:hypothetical protein
MPQHRFDDGTAWRGHAVAMTGKGIEHMLQCRRLARRNRNVHTHTQKRSTFPGSAPRAQPPPPQWDNGIDAGPEQRRGWRCRIRVLVPESGAQAVRLLQSKEMEARAQCKQ